MFEKNIGIFFIEKKTYRRNVSLVELTIAILTINRIND